MKELEQLFNRNIHQIAVSLIRQFDAQVTDIDGIIKLTLGEPDFNTPEHVKLGGIKAIQENYSHYTGMAGLLELRQVASDFFAEKYNVHYRAEDEILVTVGATEAISATLFSILEPGDKVILPSPIYPGYEPNIILPGAQPIYIDTTSNGFILTPEMIKETMAIHGDKVKAIILNHPSNPTGVTYTREEIKAIAEELRKYSIFVISDEIYSELTYTGQHVSIAEYLPEQTILINGLSKSHAMTGWRIGFIMARAAYIKEIIKVHQYLLTSAATVSQKAAISALRDGKDDGIVMKAEYKERRDFVYKKLTDLGFEIARPAGAFYIFAKIPAGLPQDSMEFCLELARQEKVAIIPGVAFGQAGEGYVRLSYAASMENLVTAMERIEQFVIKNQKK